MAPPPSVVETTLSKRLVSWINLVTSSKIALLMGAVEFSIPYKNILTNVFEGMVNTLLPMIADTELYRLVLRSLLESADCLQSSGSFDRIHPGCQENGA